MKGGIRSFFFISILCTLLASLLSPIDGETETASASKPTKRILLVYSYDRLLPAQELSEKGIRSITQSNSEFEIELFHEYLDGVRFDQPGYQETLARFLGDKYSIARPDLIITILPQALSFILNHCQHIFPGIPIVATTIFESTARALEQQTEIRQNITGVIFKGDIGDTVPVARLLRPGVRRIALVCGSSEADRSHLAIVRQALKPYEPDVEVLDLTGLAMAEIVERVGVLPADSVLLYISLTKDSQGQHFVPRQALATIAAAANVPTLGFLDSFLGYGIVGGCLLSSEAQGKKAAELAIRILSGASPQDLPFSEYDTASYRFDWRELQRWGVNEASLPVGSTIEFKEAWDWDRYEAYIIAGLFLVLLEALLIISLIKALRTSQRAQKALDASELRYRTVADYTVNWEYWSAPDGSLHYIAPACTKITGYTPQQFTENPALIHQIIVPEDQSIWDKHAHSSSEIQFRIRRTDGAIRWIEHSCQPVHDAEGKFLGIRASNKDITDRKQTEEMAQASEKDLRKLTGRLIWGQEEERRRLARELHDDLTQRLAVMAIQMGRMELAAQKGRPPQEKEFQALREQTVQISADIHAISRQLHPAILDDLGLVKAIEAECSRFAKREGIEVRFTAEGIPESLKKVVSLSLYRIVQEGLTNIAKHACARQVEVALIATEAGLSLAVRDDGIGFNAAEVGKKTGLGFSSMRERVRIIHGELHVTPKPNQGTLIEVVVPLKKSLSQKEP